MRAWRTLLIGVITILWVVAGSHCLLETLPGFAFLSCGHHPEAAQTRAHHASDCGDDGCDAVELGFYTQPEHLTALVKPAPALIAWLVPLPGACWTGPSTFRPTPSPSPPDLPKVWQFSQRTALPPRAPTFAS
jgi:hypothetical protein